MRRPVCLVARPLLWTLIVAATRLSGQQPQPIAYVLNVTGTWQLDGQRTPVTAGQPLNTGSRLSTTSISDGSITIMHCEDLSRTQTICQDSSSNPCRNPIIIGPVPSVALPDRFNSLIRAAFSVLLNKPPAVATHFSATLSRGEYVISENEDVIMISDQNEFSLTDSVPALPPGRYTVNATSPDGETSLVSEKIAHLSNGSWQAFRMPAPGLYMFSITDSDGERRADLLLWLLRSKEYRPAKEKFDAVKAYTMRWKGSNAQADQHLVLRAVLLAMSQPS